MTYSYAIEMQPAQPVVSIRKRGPMNNLPQMMHEAFEAVGAYVARIHAPIVGGTFALYHSLDMQNLDVEIGYPVKSPVPGEGMIQCRVIPAVQVAICLYKGPYDGLPTAHEMMQKWMAEQDIRPGPTLFEWYLNHPAEVKPEEALTKIAWVLP